ncbi:MAG: OsmC family protein, partial [Alphaproteobacteria bacterium]|nr:OsmC family protein [Alphaproteobacteria bacterium]
VTLKAVATALGIELVSGEVRAEGEIDMRGTLGIDREAKVGFESVRLTFDLETDAEPEALAKLLELTERYCVVYQTLTQGAGVSVSHHVRPVLA